MSKVGAVNLLNLKSVTSFLKTLLLHKPSQRVNDFLSTRGKRPLVSAFLEESLVLGQLFQPEHRFLPLAFRRESPGSLAAALRLRRQGKRHTPRSSRPPRAPRTRPMPAQEPYLFSRNAGQRRSPEHLATAIVAGRALSQRHAAGPPPGSDHGHLFVRGTRRARRS